MIDHPKVSHGDPARWNSFPGFSLLFDIGAEHHKQDELLEHLDYTSGIPVFDVLAHEVQTGLKELSQHSFCPLPKSSYHVTVWDGLNCENSSSLNLAGQDKFRTAVLKLPESLTVIASEFADCEFPEGTIKFCIEAMEVRGTAIVAALTSEGKAMQSALTEVERFREALSKDWQDRFGKPLLLPWRPHISLGYFADLATVPAALSILEERQVQFLAPLAGLRLELNHISLYGFSDMASFFKTNL